MQDGFSRFVEGGEGGSKRVPLSGTRSSTSGPDSEKRDFWESFGQAPQGPDADKKDFWDSFGDADDHKAPGHKSTGSSSIGTSAMKSKGGGPAGHKKDDEWGEW